MSNTFSALSVHALQHTEEHLSLPSSSRSPSSVVPQKNGSCPCKLASHDHKCCCGPFLHRDEPVAVAASFCARGTLGSRAAITRVAVSPAEMSKMMKAKGPCRKNTSEQPPLSSTICPPVLAPSVHNANASSQEAVRLSQQQEPHLQHCYLISCRVLLTQPLAVLKSCLILSQNGVCRDSFVGTCIKAGC